MLHTAKVKKNSFIIPNDNGIMDGNDCKKYWGIYMELNMESGGLLISELKRFFGLAYDLNGMYYNVMLFKIFSPKSFLKVENQLYLEAKKKINQLFLGKEDGIKISLGKNEMLFLLIGHSKEELDNVLDKYLTNIMCIMNTYCCLRYFGGIGKGVQGTSFLGSSWLEAKRAFVYRFIWDCSIILDYRDIPVGEQDLEELKNQRDVAHFDKCRIESFLHHADSKEVEVFVIEYLKHVGRAGKDSFLFRQYVVTDSYFITVGFIEDIGYDGNRIEKPLGDSAKMMLSVMSFNFMYEYLIGIFNHAITLRDEYDSIYKI